MKAGLPWMPLVKGTSAVEEEALVEAFAALILARKLTPLRMLKARGRLPELILPDDGFIFL